MPIFEYKCSECGAVEDRLAKFAEAPSVDSCPECGKDAFNRVTINKTGVQFTGTGYYQSDFKEKQHGSTD